MHTILKTNNDRYWYYLIYPQEYAVLKKKSHRIYIMLYVHYVVSKYLYMYPISFLQLHHLIYQIIGISIISDSIAIYIWN